MQVDDHVARLPAAVEQLVHGREGLNGTLQRADRERAAAGEHERTQELRSGTEGTRIVQSRSQKAANIAMPLPMNSQGCSGVASSACSGVRPWPTTRRPSWKPR